MPQCLICQAPYESFMSFGRMPIANGFLRIEEFASEYFFERKVGSFGDFSCFSFYPTKNLGAFWGAGMALTSNALLTARARELREYGWRECYVSASTGWNTRLDEIQAAVLRIKLRHLDGENARRGFLASGYDRGLDGIGLKLPATRPQASHVYQLYVVRCDRRNDLLSFLKSKGVGALIHYPVPVHLQPAYVGRVRTPGLLAESESLAGSILSLPLHPELQESELEHIIAAVRDFS